MKNLCTPHRIEKPHLLDYSYLIFTFFLSFFDDCHTLWQAIRVQMLPVIKLARIWHFASFRHWTRQCIQLNLEAELVWMLFGGPTPACCTFEPQSPHVEESQCHSISSLLLALGFGLRILKEPKEDLEFQSLVKSKRLQIPFWGAWVFSIRANLILITIISEKANIWG